MQPSRVTALETPSTYPLLTLRHQRVVATLTLICLCVMAGYWLREFRHRGRPINIDRPFDVEQPELLVDINEAPWHELVLLPGISETMARRIVAFREAHGRFESNEDVQRVKGIGPLTFSRLKPYLNAISAAPGNDGRE